MWKQLAALVLRNRLLFLISMGVLTILMGYFAFRVQLSYEFNRAIPTDNPKFVEYQQFKSIFGQDGNVVVLGVTDSGFFNRDRFANYRRFTEDIRSVPNVQGVMAVPGAVVIERDPLNPDNLISRILFTDSILASSSYDSAVAAFHRQPFYRSTLYNPTTHTYMMAVTLNSDSVNSKARAGIMQKLQTVVDQYEQQSKSTVHISGLPWVRTVIAERVKGEMGVFLIGSLVLSLIILFLFFRSINTTLISMGIVLVSVIWSVGLITLFGYKITLLTALIPSLVVVIGIPNCIYFINKYHTSYLQSEMADETQRKHEALVTMVSKMGIVTLFCNITAAIGFAVFALTRSAILQEFGVVSGLAILFIFIISFVLLPVLLSYAPSPSKRELRYLDSRWIAGFIGKIERWVFNHQKVVVGCTAILLVFSVMGIMRLRSVGFIVDDLPKSDRVYQDLRYFETHFKGIMPLEILIDAKTRRGLQKKDYKLFTAMDSLAEAIASMEQMNRPLSIAEGMKIGNLAFQGNDADSNYRLPGEMTGPTATRKFWSSLKQRLQDSAAGSSNSLKALSRFIDTSRRYTRMSVNMADVGTEKLPTLLARVDSAAHRYFDTSYTVTLTGTGITFLEGSKFIINGLKESILWAFALIAVCMLYLFRSLRILFCSLIPNLVPLVVTAGIMGWAGVPLKPSTVLIFSIALGIAVDITIRFLVNYRQVLPDHQENVEKAVQATVQQTGLSIIYTSLVLIAGFIIFCASRFGGTFALGWLTSVTLLVATLTNLVLLPVLLLFFRSSKSATNR